MWEAIANIFKIGADVKIAYDKKKAAEELAAREREAIMRAEDARARNDAAQMSVFQAQADSARRSFNSIVNPSSASPFGTSQAAVAPARSPLDAYLPFIVLGVVGLGAIAVLRK